MRFSRRLSLAFLALVGVSLALKLIASRGEPQPDANLFAGRVSAFLASEGFATRSEMRGLGMMVEGRRGDCRLEVRDYGSHGTYADALAKVARRTGPLRFVYRGRLSEEAPRFFPLVEYFVGRELRRIGFPVPRAPVLAIAARPECALDRLAWSKVATFAR